LLRIDLLPEHFAAARAAKAWLFLMVLLLLASIVGCFGWLMMTKGKLAAVQAEYEEWHAKAEEVRQLEQEAGSLETLAAPTGAKVSFIEEADASGEPYWAAFDKVNRYIYARAQVLSFSIQPPNRAHFEVEVPDTTTCGRFVLNLIRCPDISNIRFGGSIPGGPAVGPNAAGGVGGGGMDMGMEMGGMAPGMGMPGEMPGMEGMPSMGGGMGAPSGGGVARAGGPIRLTVDADLRETIATPQPGGGAAPAAAPGMMAGMGEGMMEGEAEMMMMEGDEGMGGEGEMGGESAEMAPGEDEM
jgi:hypothetical protein